ncbi:hypothetical protein MKEN_00445200 [Mycena kentingensis (nom. inval.)]|nr:hypothetical protein MKEN_00445200 [Mycena kentingensis (nom. inval.)]
MLSFSPACTQRLDEIISAAVASNALPALSVAISGVDGPLYSYQKSSKSRLIDEHTVFWWCSQSKLVTSIAALQMVEQGKIAFETPVADILPELANPVIVTKRDPVTRKILATIPAKSAITFGQLLNHTSGIDYSLDSTAPLSGPLPGLSGAYTHNYGAEDVSKFFKILQGDLPGFPLRFEPGTGFAYSFGTDCVGFIIERLSGKTLEQYFQDHIFGPLGMSSTTFCLTPELKERLLSLSVRDGATYWSHPVVMDLNIDKARTFLGGVGLYGTVPSFCKLTTHLLQLKARHAVTHPLLTATSVDCLFTSTLEGPSAATFSSVANSLTPHVNCPPAGAQFSRSLFVNTVNISGKRRAYSGSWGGYANTSYFIDPTTGISMMVATQLSPPLDDAFCKLCDELEKEVYAAIGSIQ